MAIVRGQGTSLRRAPSSGCVSAAALVTGTRHGELQAPGLPAKAPPWTSLLLLSDDFRFLENNPEFRNPYGEGTESQQVTWLGTQLVQKQWLHPIVAP